MQLLVRENYLDNTFTIIPVQLFFLSLFLYFFLHYLCRSQILNFSFSNNAKSSVSIYDNWRRSTTHVIFCHYLQNVVDIFVTFLDLFWWVLFHEICVADQIKRSISSEFLVHISTNKRSIKTKAFQGSSLVVWVQKINFFFLIWKYNVLRIYCENFRQKFEIFREL